MIVVLHMHIQVFAHSFARLPVALAKIVLKYALNAEIRNYILFEMAYALQ